MLYIDIIIVLYEICQLNAIKSTTFPIENIMFELRLSVWLRFTFMMWPEANEKKANFVMLGLNKSALKCVQSWFQVY